MRHPRLTISLAPVLSVLLSGAALAYPANYPPYAFRSRPPWAELQARPILEGEGTLDDPEEGIRVTAGKRFVEVTAGQTLIMKRKLPKENWAAPRVYHQDLTGDGLKDVLIYSSAGGGGLAHLRLRVDLLIRIRAGGFLHHTYAGFAPGPEDFIDTEGKGRSFLIWAGVAGLGERVYWVYRLIEFADSGARFRDGAAPGFPKMILYTEKPNDRPEAALTAAEHEKLLRASARGWEGTYRMRRVAL